MNIHSIHYNGSPNKSVIPNVAPNDIRSMQQIPVTVGSYGHATNKPIVKGNKVISRTVHNVYTTPLSDYNKFGPVTQLDDSRMEEWIANGTENTPSKNSVIPTMPDMSYITTAWPIGLYFPNRNDTKVPLYHSPEIVNAVHPNKVGIFESKRANLELMLRGLFKTGEFQDEASEWVSYLAEQGAITKSGKVIGLGVETGDHFAAVYPNRHYLVTESNFHEKSKRLSAAYGLSQHDSIEAMKRSIILHELAHVLGVDSEKQEGKLQAEFYSKLANKFKGTRKGTIYSALAEEAKDYEKMYSPSWFQSLFQGHDNDANSLDLLITKFEAEAKALGIEGHAARHYVNDRLENTYGALLKEDSSYKNGKNNSNQKGKSGSKEKSKDDKSDGEQKAPEKVDNKSEKTDAAEKAEPSEAAEAPAE